MIKSQLWLRRSAFLLWLILKKMNNKIQPALIGGVILGLLSAIPFVNIANSCCCLWVLLGGTLSVYLYVKRSPTPVQYVDGLQLGAMAGVVGAIINLVVG